jgi:hypothetical protein
MLILEPPRTPNPECPACQGFREHRPEEWRQHHPLAGTGAYGPWKQPGEPKLGGTTEAP